MTIFIILTWTYIFIGSWLDPTSICFRKTTRDTHSKRHSCLWRKAIRGINRWDSKIKCSKELKKDEGHFNMSQQGQENLSGSWGGRRRNDTKPHPTLSHHGDCWLIYLENWIIIQRDEQGSSELLLLTHKPSGGPGCLCVLKISTETEKLQWTRRCTGG